MYRTVFTLFFFASSTLNAYACTCLHKDYSFDNVITNSEIVFIGKPIATKPVNSSSCRSIDFSHLGHDLKSKTICSGLMVTRFQVTTPIKGNLGKTVDIRHENASACGISFELKMPIAINSSATNGAYGISYCSIARFHLETFQAYALTSPAERNCMEQISDALEPLMEQEAFKAYIDPTTQKEPYSLSMLNLDPFCEAYWPTYQETFGNLAAKTLHAIISAPAEPVRVEPEIRQDKDVRISARPVFKYLIAIGLLSLTILAVLLMRRRVLKS